MKLSDDPAANVAYIRFGERRGDGETIRLTDDFLVDIDETGAVCVESFNAREQLTAVGDGRLVVLDAPGGQAGALQAA